MELKDTASMMSSPDYQERFRAEYLQLQIRIEGLSNMLAKYKAGTLPFVPSCSYELLDTQLDSMILYKKILVERARIEKININ